MHRLRTGRLAGGDDLVGDQIGLARRRRTDADGFVRQFDVQRVGVRLGVHRDGGDAHATRGADDAAGDLATVCDQDLVKHGGSPRRGRPHTLRM